MTRKPPPVLLGCGHFATVERDGKPACLICAEKASVERIKAEAVSVHEANPFTPATVATTAVAARAIGETEPQPGVYEIPDSIYHRDPLKAYGTESLSGSSARLLLPPSTPAHYRYRIDHPSNGRTPAMIFGGAVHALALNTADLAVFDGNSWASKAGDRFLAEHDPDGDEAPILARDVAPAKAMAAALHAHPIVKMGLSNGSPEQAMFAQDPQTGVWLRGKVDYLARAAGGHLIVTDIKTTECAHESEFARSVGKFSYHVQDAQYARIIKLLKLAKTVTMIFAAVEKEPPYLVNVHEIDSVDIRRAYGLHDMAVRRFAHCLKTGQWDGYPVRINKISLPVWIARAEEDALSADEGDDE